MADPHIKGLGTVLDVYTCLRKGRQTNNALQAFNILRAMVSRALNKDNNDKVREGVAWLEAFLEGTEQTDKDKAIDRIDNLSRVLREERKNTVPTGPALHELAEIRKLLVNESGTRSSTPPDFGDHGE